MFRAARRLSSGALNCICSLWFTYTCGDRPLSSLSGKWIHLIINSITRLHLVGYFYWFSFSSYNCGTTVVFFCNANTNPVRIRGGENLLNTVTPPPSQPSRYRVVSTKHRHRMIWLVSQNVRPSGGSTHWAERRHCYNHSFHKFINVRWKKLQQSAPWWIM
jgi:hypothetical protein